MFILSLDDFDKHIQNLRLQLTFFASALDATDHNAPDWLATDLIGLRNKSGRLQDDMQKFKDQIESAGFGVRKTSKKRFSLEGAKSTPSPSFSRTVNPSTSEDTPTPSSPPQPPTPKRLHPENDYIVQHVDVTVEVNRRVQENRLRRMQDSPSTSQKRKYDALADTRGLEGGEDDTNAEEANAEEANAESLDKERSPKKLRASSGFERFEKRWKRKDGGGWEGDSRKRRRM